MTLPVSVVVASRGRPEALARCLRGLSQLLYPSFEIVVVTDAAGRRAMAGYGERIKVVPFDVPNLAAARNAGIGQAAGEIVAFIDDDSVPEPTWLSWLVGPFADAQVAAVGGLVRGRNGISVQWGPAEVDSRGARRALDLPMDRATVRGGRPGLGLKTEGTSMAVRRTIVAAMGGFDPAFPFYLDDTDLDLRLAAAGAVVAWEPRAEVHHGFLESERRRADRVPRTLFDIGASLAAFGLRHAPGAEGLLAEETARQRRRLLQHMVAGRLEPRELGPLMATLAQGWEAGQQRRPGPLPPLGWPEGGFRPFRAEPPIVPAGILAGRLGQRKRLLAEAVARARKGERPSLFVFSRTAIRHRVEYHPEGVWVQSGGLFGPAVRSEPRWKAWRFDQRVAKEVARVREARAIDREGSGVYHAERIGPEPQKICHKDDTRET